ncbi:MAG: 3D-(3,5/4)-trihydroxycyclohexane-1,2-dione acylhydrolase (decyclizing) [Chloroflexi bacterium]|nr:3D-(3,5/4)-trihydroxycyclohexane-1,2-dione acylhydrolase (decyclizing) [Chloroflexota bacterium]
MKTERLTMAQALVRFLAAQHVERDGVTQRALAGMFGIFGHGNVAGVGQALHQHRDRLTYRQARNEQAMVHAAIGYARMKDRLQMLACTTSIGPGATNMITGAAAATIDRIPVLLLPGDVFASRRPDPVLQQLEGPGRGDISVNDAFRPVSRYWDRITRPEQIVPAALAAMRVLTSPADTGAVTLSLCQDVQTEAFDVPLSFLEDRAWHIDRRMPDPDALARAIALVRGAKRPLLVAGGGVIYSAATDALRRLCDATGIPVAETQAGKGSLRFDHPSAVGAVGVTGTLAANRIARDADVVIGIGTRWSDLTTMSKSAFERADVRFINVNVAEFDAQKHSGIALVGDARATLEALSSITYHVDDAYRTEIASVRGEWGKEVDRLYGLGNAPLPARSEIIGAVNEAAGERGVVVCAAGAMPGDLHRLWRARDPKQYHVEYGYSTMGYEIAGALGVKMAAPDREVFVLVGDGSYLMLHTEIVTAVELGLKLTVVLVDDQGFASIGGLSRSVGSEEFGTKRSAPVDFVANARSLGAAAVRAKTVGDLRSALKEAQKAKRTTVIVVEADRYAGVPSYASWWDVAVAETSEQEGVRKARKAYEEAKRRQRWHV